MTIVELLKSDSTISVEKYSARIIMFWSARQDGWAIYVNAEIVAEKLTEGDAVARFLEEAEKVVQGK